MNPDVAKTLTVVTLRQTTLIHVGFRFCEDVGEGINPLKTEFILNNI
jgi:hypothetical protein